MKAEEFLKRLHRLDEVFKLHDDAEYNERQLTQFAERYHESELKLLSIVDVSRQSEQAFCPNCKVFHYNKDYDGYCCKSCWDSIEAK